MATLAGSGSKEGCPLGRGLVNLALVGACFDGILKNIFHLTSYVQERGGLDRASFLILLDGWALGFLAFAGRVG